MLKPFLLFPVYCFQHRFDVDADRAGAYAPAAAGAERLAELVVVVLELVHDPVAVALVLEVARVVAGGVAREFAEAAGVPVLAAGPLLVAPLVDDVEAVAGGAEEGAGAAAGATGRHFFPERALEVAVQPALYFFQVHRSPLGDGGRERFKFSLFFEQLREPGQERLALRGGRLHLEPAPLQRGEEQVASPGLGGGEPDQGAEAGVVALGAGEADDGALLPSRKIKLVVVVPGEDRVEDARRRGVAG